MGDIWLATRLVNGEDVASDGGSGAFALVLLSRMIMFSLDSRSLAEFRRGVVAERLVCNFCWCRNTKSLLAKQRPHAAHWNGFSLVWDLSWRLRCSSRAKARVHTEHI